MNENDRPKTHTVKGAWRQMGVLRTKSDDKMGHKGFKAFRRWVCVSYRNEMFAEREWALRRISDDLTWWFCVFQGGRNNRATVTWCYLSGMFFFVAFTRWETNASLSCCQSHCVFINPPRKKVTLLRLVLYICFIPHFFLLYFFLIKESQRGPNYSHFCTKCSCVWLHIHVCSIGALSALIRIQRMELHWT